MVFFIVVMLMNILDGNDSGFASWESEIYTRYDGIYANIAIRLML